MSGLFGQMSRFAAVGLANTALGLAAIYGLMFFFGVTPVVANAAGYALGLTAGFALNRIWTFQSRYTVQQIPRYLLVVGLSYAANLAATVAAISWLRLGPYLAQLIGIAFYTSLMFCGCRWFVFPHGRPQANGEATVTSPYPPRTSA